MPPRRSHKKSRAGCRRCKNRKIKCDEVHPRCGNCVKHGVACDFTNPDVLLDEPVSATTISVDNFGAPTPTPTSSSSNAPKTPSVRASPPTPTTPMYPQPSPSIASSVSTQVDRMLELRLMHQYTNVTSKTILTSSMVTERIWQREVPQMAFSGTGKTYLADAILSVAALHLRSQNPEDKALVRASHAYTASTLSSYCAALNSGITSDNAEALFLTASLIAFQSTASRIFVKDDAVADSGGTNRYALPLPWFHAFQGVKTVVASSWQWICHSTTVKAVIDSQPSFQLDLNPRSDDSFFGHLLEGMEDELVAEDPRHAFSTGQAYSHAVCVINWAHKNYYAAAALAFPSTVSRRFIELVEAKRPRALAILACFFALLKRMDGVWWLQDVSRREVMGLVGMFEPGSKWWRHLEWPIRIAVWDGHSIPADVWGAECEEEPRPQAGLVDTMVHHIELMADIMTKSQTQPQIGMPNGPPIPILDEPPLPDPDEEYITADSPD